MHVVGCDAYCPMRFFLVQKISVGLQANAMRCMWSDAMRCMWSDAMRCDAMHVVGCDAVHMVRCDAMHVVRCGAYCLMLFFLVQKDQSDYKPVRCGACGALLFFLVQRRSVGLRVNAMRCIWFDAMRCIWSNKIRTRIMRCMWSDAVRCCNSMWEKTFPRNSHAGLGKDLTTFHAH